MTEVKTWKVYDKEKDEFICPFCKKRFKSFRNFRKHCRARHFLNECPICGKKHKNIVSHFAHESEFCVKHKILYSLFCITRAFEKFEKFEEAVRELSEKEIQRFKQSEFRFGI